MPADILARADSTMVSLFGPDIFDRYCERSSTTLYEYKSKKKSEKKKYATLSKYKKGVSNQPTKGIFVSATVGYQVRIKENDFTIYNDTYVRFDSDMAVTAPDITVIPQYIRENKPCNFITREQAAELAESYLNDMSGPALTKATVSYIAYDHLINGYSWMASRKKWESQEYDREPFGRMEYVHIDAVTGKAGWYSTDWFGPVPLP